MNKLESYNRVTSMIKMLWKTKQHDQENIEQINEKVR